MFALKPASVRGLSARGPSGTGDRFVLPRWLRRPARLFSRLGTGDFTAPRYSASAMTVALFLATGVYGTYVAGNMPALVQALTAHSGFAVDQIRVVGHRETSEIDVLGKLDLDGWTSLVGFDVEKARERVAELPWVQSAAVRKIYPDSLEIRIQERQAFAVWQHGSDLSIIGEKGNVIVPFDGAVHASLPLVVGADAAEGAAAFIGMVRSHPELAKRVRGYIEVAERRWNLRLDNGVTVKLPEADADQAIDRLIAIDRDRHILSRDVVAVDMRFPDRVVAELSPQAAADRLAAISQNGKTAKKLAGKKT